MSRRSIQVRVDKDVWGKVSEILPRESNVTRSRLLYQFSLLNAESVLRSADKQVSKTLGIYDGGEPNKRKKR